MEDRRLGVLVIITGGNIGLVATTDKRGNTVLGPVSKEHIGRIVLGEEGGTSVLLREGSLQGTSVSVGFDDIREQKRKYSDPEELDSAQVDPQLWAYLAEKIKENYDKFEGFVVLHGLDTMAYTASALAFMLPNLQTPIILTGSQRPLNYPRTDATQNIFSALTLAASASLGIRPLIPEVCVYSYDTLYRGNRVSMVNASSYRSFDSPNFPPLGTVGEHIDIQTHLVREPSQTRVLNVKAKVDAKVVILDVFPGMDAGIISSLTKDRALRGVLLRTYGMGTAPTSPAVLSALQKLTENKIVVMNVTQARSGRISHGSDPVSLRLFEQGVISGIDMTAEAAYAKMVVLSSDQSVSDDVADLLQIETCGEQSLSIYTIHFAAGETKEDEGEASARAFLRPIKSVTQSHQIQIDRIRHIQLRILGVAPALPEEGKPVNRTIELEAFLVDPHAEPRPGQKSAAFHLKTDILRWSARGRPTINIAYDITFGRDRLLSPDQIPSSILQLETNEPIRWRRLNILIYHSIDGESV